MVTTAHREFRIYDSKLFLYSFPGISQITLRLLDVFYELLCITVKVWIYLRLFLSDYLKRNNENFGKSCIQHLTMEPTIRINNKIPKLGNSNVIYNTVGDLEVNTNSSYCSRRIVRTLAYEGLPVTYIFNMPSYPTYYLTTAIFFISRLIEWINPSLILKFIVFVSEVAYC